jgi:hypothetical protein
VKGFLSAAACALAAAALVASPAAAAPAELGVNVNRVFNDAFDGDRWNLHLGAVRESGIRMARTDAFWQAVEPDPPDSEGEHTYDFTYLDFVAIALANHELRWQPILDYSALWASSVPGDDHAPPRDPDDYARYAAAFAKRYGRGGTLWEQYDPKSEEPVTTYEIWNEPNLHHFWQPEPDPEAYMELYAKARDAIKAVDPDALVLVGGLVPGTGFERALYATRPDAAAIVDGVAFHPYASTPAGVIREVRNLRATLEELGDPDAPIHLTELGWVTNPPDAWIHAPDEQRAQYLSEAVRALAWSDCGVDTVIPYTWTTPESDASDIEDWYGMFHPDGTHSATSRAYAELVAERASGADPDTQRICHPPDADSDGQPDPEDPDDDNDTAPDATDVFPLDPVEQADLDGDGTGDNADADDDADGVADDWDRFPRDAAEWLDTDLDGSGENADPDDDNDGSPDLAELAIGTSSVDTDSDDDGLGDVIEIRTSPTNRDSDGDRMPDGLERGVTIGLPDGPGLVSGTKPSRFLADTHPPTKTLATRADSDRDGLTDRREDRDRDGRRDRTETDPLKRDTDRDRVPDGRDRSPLSRRGA